MLRRSVRRLLRFTVRIGGLAGLAYAAYRLITASRDQPGDEASRLGHDSDLNAGRIDPAPSRRVGAGTKPGGTTRPPASKPRQPEQPTTQTVRSIGVGEVPEHIPRWVEPQPDGSCPASHPVKANMGSKIFHVPEGAHYDRTRADRCYRDPDSAEADGLRRSKQ